MVRDSSRNAIIGISVFVVLVLLVILAGAILGMNSVKNILIFIMVAVIVLVILGILVYAIYYLFFKKNKFDATYMNKKNFIIAGRISKPDNIMDLYLSGDKQHSRVRVGKIKGFCRVQIIKKVVEYDDNTGLPVQVPDEKDPSKTHEKFTIDKLEQDVFVVEKSGFPMNLFEEPMVIRVDPDSHNELVGDVTIMGFSLLPIAEYFYVNDKYLDVGEIDRSIKLEAFRTIYFEALKDTKEVVDMAMGIDSDHKKAIEGKNLYEIPNMGPQQGQGGS